MASKNRGGDTKDPRKDNRTKQGKGAGGRDDDRQPGGQGRVKDPAHDGRLKENR